MRFNDSELLKVSKGTAVIEGILQYMKPQNKDWSDWYQHPVFKERIFKLVNNLLFYFRINDLEEPLGLIVLENMQVAYENVGPAFAFSLMFPDGKHIFACRCQEDVNRWVAALKMSSYNYWRSLYTILQTKISMKTGKDEVLNYVQNKQFNEPQNMLEVISKKMSKSTFYSRTERTTITTTTREKISSVPIDNLIDL